MRGQILALCKLFSLYRPFMLEPHGCLSSSSIHESSTGGEVFTHQVLLFAHSKDLKVFESCHGTHTTLDGEPVRCGAIRNDPGTSEDDSLCPQNTEGDVQTVEQLNWIFQSATILPSTEIAHHDCQWSLAPSHHREHARLWMPGKIKLPVHSG